MINQTEVEKKFFLTNKILKYQLVFSSDGKINLNRFN